jgi:hypothetical protein
VGGGGGELGRECNCACWGECTLLLNVPKREIFVTELYTLSEPIWVGDLGTEAKNPFV